MKRVSIAVLFVLLAVARLPGQYQSVTSHGLAVHYRVFGTGAPLLVIGGGPGDNADRYLGLCDLLAKGHRCILVDQRGTGRSQPAVCDATTISLALTLDDFEAIRRRLGLPAWSVLGFSYGGYVASLYAQRFPASVSRLVLLGSMGLNNQAFGHFLDNINSRLQPADLELIAYWSDPARAEQDPHHAMVERIRAMMPGYFFDRRKSLLVSQAMKDADFNFAMGRWIWAEIEAQGLDLAKGEAAFAGPVLVLHGRQDPLGESVPQALARHYRRATLRFIEKAGHYSWVEQPETVYAAVREFLAAAD